VEFYQDLLYKKWKLLFRRSPQKSFMERYWMDHRDNMFIYKHAFGGVGLFDSTSLFCTTFIWWERYEQKRYFHFLYEDDVRVVSEKAINSFKQLSEEVEKCAREYYAFKGDLDYSLRKGCGDIKHLFTTLIFLFKRKHGCTFYEKMKFTLVLLHLSFVRIRTKIRMSNQVKL